MKIFVMAALALSLFLTGCGGQSEASSPLVIVSGGDTADTAVQSDDLSYETLVDEQGAVSITITPVELSETATMLRFEVALNTHSVELDMDLAGMATLTTDGGQVVPASQWDAEPGGHHVSGVLSFPATVEGTATLMDASEVILTIRDVDIVERVFTWTLVN